MEKKLRINQKKAEKKGLKVRRTPRSLCRRTASRRKKKEKNSGRESKEAGGPQKNKKKKRLFVFKGGN